MRFSHWYLNEPKRWWNTPHKSSGAPVSDPARFNPLSAPARGVHAASISYAARTLHTEVA
jgi:hypothetical protein